MCEWVCKWVCEYCTVVPETTGVHTESSQVCRVSHDRAWHCAATANIWHLNNLIIKGLNRLT